MSLASERYAYPLVAVYPSRFVSRRYAVIGDAAVGMHPVTAHGFNLGLVGQDTLAGLVRAAHTRGADIASDEVLQRYDRAHRRATLPLFLATNAIVRLYTDDSPPARLVRGALLGAASRVAPIGSLLTRILMQRGSLLPSPTPHRQPHDVTGGP
jgi:2-polyprenyl-6-methoxyphenol hydroxylase-like FAD-dependent oxidoreductase